MQVTINKVFPLDGSVSDAWNLLENIEQVASCMPGAEITEKVDENNFKGSVKVKIGPMHVAFNGDIAVQKINPGEHQIHLIAKGQDSKGTSSASMDLTASVRTGESGASELTGDADVTVNGKLANFGGRMMTQVADQILGQFADNFSSKLGASAVSEDSTQTVSEPEPQVQEINGLKFAWQALIGFIKSFFTSKA
ncbi:MAG TPA: SRPBCC family protein [Gammaproteobacteria bacterium]|nr:SRPBCC family protein [Gammaproteobacteria bacterium]